MSLFDGATSPRWFMLTMTGIVLLGALGGFYGANVPLLTRLRSLATMTFPIATGASLSREAKPLSAVPVPSQPPNLASQSSSGMQGSPSPAITSASKPDVILAGPQSALATVIVKISANIRVTGEAGATVVGVAQAGEKLLVFGRANGWLQIGRLGAAKPIGWVGAALTTTD